jgi:hypothetical protein
MPQVFGAIDQNRKWGCFIGAASGPRIPVRGKGSIIWGE